MDQNNNIDGFNKGYEPAKVDKDLAFASINQINETSSEKLQYFREGVLEYEKEKLYEKMQSQDKSIDKDIDKD